MKKILLIIVSLFLLFSLTSCKKEDATKDFENSIEKLKYFNTQFETYYADGVISKKSSGKGEVSEFDDLKKIATEYYELMNKINRTVEAEREDLKDGQTVSEYEKLYQELENIAKEKQDVLAKNDVEALEAITKKMSLFFWAEKLILNFIIY